MTNYSKVNGTKDRHRSQCKSCRASNEKEKRKTPEYKKRVKAYKARTKRRTKHLALKRIFGITIDDFDRMLEEQKGVCAICFKPEGFKKRSLAVDHCHTTGKVRGLLCTRCNQGLGHLNDDITLLESSIKYLRESRE